ncbi:MAG TPA: tetratricopeptide repeat protein [Planctomycetaceae bacterium]|nr:tetratricopeptide repeat protein [Planctomycetaceae bacterium]
MADPFDIEQALKLAQRHVRHQEYAEAIAQFQQILAQDETNLAALDGLAATEFLAGNLDEAARHFTRITQLDFRSGKALINLGAVYNRMGDYRRAADVLRRGLQREKKSAQGYYNLGIAQRHLGQNTLAVNAYREAIRIDPQMAEAHQNLANLYHEMGSHKQSIEHYRKALKINPEFERAQRGLTAAEQAQDATKRSASPFGRLVDTGRTGAKGAVTLVRELSDPERIQERKQLHELSVKLRATAKSFLNFCRDEMETSLLALSRAMAQGLEKNRIGIARAFDAFDTACQRAVAVRRAMKRSVLEVRAHEELINTPDMTELDT